MSSTMFQAAVGGFPNTGAGFHGIQARRGFAGLADVSSDDAIIAAGRMAISRAEQYPQIMNSAPPIGGWTSSNAGLANEYYNLVNQIAAGTSGGWGAGATAHEKFLDEVRQRTARVLAYLPASDPAPVVTTPAIVPVAGGAPVIESGVLPAPVSTESGLDGTISLPIVGAIPTKIALLIGAGIAAYFFLGK